MSQSSRMELVSGDVGVLSLWDWCLVTSEPSPVELASGDVSPLPWSWCLVTSESSPLELVSGDVRVLSCGAGVW